MLQLCIVIMDLGRNLLRCFSSDDAVQGENREQRECDSQPTGDRMSRSDWPRLQLPFLCENESPSRLVDYDLGFVSRVHGRLHCERCIAYASAGLPGDFDGILSRQCLQLPLIQERERLHQDE